jgi:transcriptional regulator with XRE-family HTH domain
MDFWDRVESLIKQEKTSYAYIAKKLGKPESTVSGWHRKGAKHRIPEADFAVKIAQALGTSVEYLVTGKNPEGLPPEALSMARKIAALDHFDQEEIRVLVETKLKRYNEEDSGAQPDAKTKKNPRKTG